MQAGQIMTDKDLGFWFGLWESYKIQGGSAALAFIMGYLRARYNGEGLSHALLGATMCALVGWFTKDVLVALDFNPDLAYLGSVAIGYLGTNYLATILKNKLGNGGEQ